MSIARLKKITVAGSLTQQADIIAALHAYGRFHIIDQRHPTLPDEAAVLPRDQKASEALLYLQLSRYKRQAIRQDARFDYRAVVDQALSLKQQQKELEDARRVLRRRLAIVRPWGYFQFPPQAYVNVCRFWFYRLPLHFRRHLKTVELPWQIVGQSNTRLHVIVISPDEPPPALLPVAREHVGSKSLAELERDEQAVQAQLEEVLAQRQKLTAYLFLMQRHQIQADNQAYFHYVMQQTQKWEGFFTLQAWLPIQDLPSLNRLSQEKEFAWTAEDPQSMEQAPTLLQPMKGFNAGARLAGIYQLPGYRGWDPSVHLYLWFSLFFAMILSDAGYAMVLGVALAVRWRSLGVSQGRVVFRALLRFMVFVATGWGILVGSYWGFSPPPEGVLARLHVLDMSNYDTMMKVAVGMGVLHIVVAQVSVAVQQGWRRLSHLARVGWMILALEAFCIWIFSGETESTSPSALFDSYGFELYGLGAVAMGFIVLFSGSQAVNSAEHLMQRLFSGVLALTRVTALFGDALSYLRLFALGLASASLAMTFNELALNAFHVGGMGMLGAVLILLLGHVINLALGILSGVVHGLRLNFIEFYNWAEPGEGYAFTPFALKEAVYE
ncbi:MAG: V-type ATPase 116kDa subunit family protein [Gammaproteobacteria bacterium]